MMNNRNRMANAKNQYQGDAKRVLCVCSAGLLRSPTLANVLHREFGFNTRACGSSREYALIPINEVLIHWADEIIFVAYDNFSETEKHFSLSGETVYVLDTPDCYSYMDNELQDALLEAFNNAREKW